MSALNSTVGMMICAGLMLTSPVIRAQNAGGGAAMHRRNTASPMQESLRRSNRTLDRMHERMHDRVQDRLYERDLRRERDRDRIYGAKLMSTAERQRYEHRLRSLASDNERVQFRLQHQRDMQMRARREGVSLGRMPSETRIREQERARQRERRQIYGYSMMSPTEVARYEARMGAARTAQERERIRSEHHRQMQHRAHQRGESAPK